MSIQSAPLGELSDITSGFAFKSSLFNTDGQGLPLIRIRDVVGGESKTFYSGEYKPEYVIHNGDALIGMDGEFNLARWKGGKALLNQRVCKIESSDDRLDQEYLIRLLPNALKEIEARTPFVTVKHLSVKEVRAIKIPLPPLPEQRRIAAILDKADALCQKRRQAIEKLDQLLQSVFLDMFGDPVTNPKGWEEVSIADVCSHVVDCVNRTAPIVDHETPYKMIRTTNVRNGKVSLDTVRRVDTPTFEKWNRRLVPQKGDVILTREAPAGEAGILESDDQVFLGQRLMLYRCNTARLTPEYLLFTFINAGMQRQFLSNSSGSTVKHLSVPACRNWSILCPPISMQEDFSRRVTLIQSINACNAIGLQKGEHFFSSLQQRAFNGTL